jgi:orotidine-5'-phosphate decarboxylase
VTDTAAPLAIALDAPDLATATAWAAATAPYVVADKVGLELFTRHGPDAVDAVREASGRPVFLDLKLHDIPRTVAGAARSVARLEPAYLTVHAAGGADMVAAAVDELPTTLVTGVTVLTSLDAETLAAVGFAGAPLDVVRRLAVIAVGAGARALVCSPREVAAVRAEVGPDIALVTPGIRAAGADVGDQARVTTAEAALDAGADLLVVGRPVTGAPDPGAAAAALATGLRAHLARARAGQ